MIGKGSKSFAAASRLFDRTTRERVWLLYAWCRRCDDLIDGQDLGGDMGDQSAVTSRLQQVRALTTLALTGGDTGEPAFDCLGVVAAETGLTQDMADAVIAGFALDARGWSPQTEADLMQYCWHVAGAVGVMMAVVMGVDPDDDETLDRACDLGLAFQLANISRDLAEDFAAGRCYLPAQWLAEAAIPAGDALNPRYRDALAGLAARMCGMAAAYESSARIGARRLEMRQRWAILAAAGIYGDIARLVKRRGANAWDTRTVVSTTRKIGWIGRSLVQTMLPVTARMHELAAPRRHTRHELAQRVA
ncbi:phytoene/squalene synthase family protein [Novosphingobium sp.]|uniref:phytoene/squalene synthase family protein n=1 Tax=Novosphingobium sp. TaxID=1874826 RepID=UPI00334179F4